MAHRGNLCAQSWRPTWRSPRDVDHARDPLFPGSGTPINPTLVNLRAMDPPSRQAMDRDRDHPDDPGQREDVHSSGSSKAPPDQLEIFRVGDRQTVSRRITAAAHDAAALRSSEQSDTE